MASEDGALLTLDTGICTLPGNRSDNQDRCFAASSGGATLLGLADGMGGHPMGEVAAQIFVDTSERELYRAPRPVPRPARFLQRILELAHREIQRFGEQQWPPVQPRTTAVLALVQAGGLHWAYVGDSRLYLFRQGRLLSRTADHSYVERLRQQGLIDADQLDLHPQRNYVTRCLGGNGAPQENGRGEQALQPGDILLLCSDGLWQSVSEESMCEVLFNEADMGRAAALLAEEAATAAFPSSDNVTVVAGRVSRESRQTGCGRVRSTGKETESDGLADAVQALERAIADFEGGKSGPE